MEITINEPISKISIPFTVNDGVWYYQDILEFDNMPTDEELNKIIEEKFNTWKAYVETPLSSN